jgi:molybdopterin converting factor small subunit
MTPDGPQSHLDLELEEGTNLGQVVEILGYADQIDNTILVINGQVADPADILKDGDTVRLMPAISGG